MICQRMEFNRREKASRVAKRGRVSVWLIEGGFVSRREIIGKQGYFLKFSMGSQSVEGWVEKRKWDVAFMRTLGQDPK